MNSLSEKAKGNIIGFVPTMGALHRRPSRAHEQVRERSGYYCLQHLCEPHPIQRSQRLFNKYPNKIEKDIKILVSAGADVLFLPEPAEIIPQWDGQLGTLRPWLS